MGAILAIVHPEQYDTGLMTLKRIEANPNELREPEFVGEMLKKWCCPFSGISALFNVRTPEHRDPLGQHNWYDLLATMGTYTEHQLQLPGLGTSVAYRPRSVVAIAGRVISHTADHPADGERGVFAFFSREGVRRSMELPEGGYSTLERAVIE